MKTTITSDDSGRVTIEYNDACEDKRVSRTFICPKKGGYVSELTASGGTTQPCEGLAGTGNTLTCASRDDLISVIRKEYRKMRRFEKRYGLL